MSINRSDMLPLNVGLSHLGSVEQIEKTSQQAIPDQFKAPDKQQQQQIRTVARQQLGSPIHANFAARSQATWAPLIANNPEISAKIEEFKSAHPEKMQTIKDKSWNALKKELGTGMVKPTDSDQLSMEGFRSKANAFVDDLLKTALEDMGMPEVTWSASGTAGYNSDVDTAMHSKEPLTLDQAYTIKFLRDSAHTMVFGGLSGTQLDTESYTPHVAFGNTAKELTLSEFKEQFTSSECAMAILQSRVGFQNHLEHWETFCSNELNNISNPERRESTQAIMKTVEEWHNNMNFDTLKQVLIENPPAEILDQLPVDPSIEEVAQKVNSLSPSEVKSLANAQIHKDPDSLKRAGVNQRAPIMLQLAANKTTREGELSQMQQKLQHLREHNASDPQLPELTYNYEKRLLEADVVQKMLNSLQDEGTFGQAEGNVTLFREGGQIDAGVGAKQVKVFKSEVEKMEYEIAQNKMKTALNVNTLRETVKNGRARREAPTAEELTLAAYEEQQQFSHVVQDGLDKSSKSNDPAKTAQETAISAGKYCLRTTRNKLRAMEQVEKDFKAAGKELSPDFYVLKNEMKNAEDSALNLEQCKRKFTLNKVSSTILLQEAISNTPKGKDLDSAKIREDISAMLNRVGQGTDETVLKREKVNAFVRELQGLGYLGVEDIQILTPNTATSIADKALPTNDGIRTVLQGMAGYSRVSLKTDHSDLNPLFEKADQITTTELGINTADELSEFHGYIEGLSQSWQNMAFDLGVLTPMANKQWITENLNYNQLWQEAKQQMVA